MPRPTNATLRSNCSARSHDDLQPVDAVEKAVTTIFPRALAEDLLEAVDDVALGAR